MDYKISNGVLQNIQYGDLNSCGLNGQRAAGKRANSF